MYAVGPAMQIGPSNSENEHSKPYSCISIEVSKQNAADKHHFFLWHLVEMGENFIKKDAVAVEGWCHCQCHGWHN